MSRQCPIHKYGTPRRSRGGIGCAVEARVHQVDRIPRMRTTNDPSTDHLFTLIMRYTLPLAVVGVGWGLGL